MKKILLLSLTLILCLSSCSKNESFKDTAPCSEIADKVEEQFSIDLGYDSYDADFIKYNFDEASLCDDSALRYSVQSSDID